MNKTFLGACITALLMASTGCGNYDPPQGDEDNEEAVSPYQEGIEEELGEELAPPPTCRTPATCSDSVYYARCRQPRLPRGLRSYRDKVAIINSDRPFPGCVAVINNRTYSGHIAYIERYDRHNRIVYISEGDWPNGRCGYRGGTERQLDIVGYWCPRRGGFEN